MTDGLKDAHREAVIAALAANERVERAVLFGSRATGTNTVTSDVDIALFGDRLTLTDQARLAAVIDEIPMAQSVDLILYDSVRDRTLLEHIRNDGVEWFTRKHVVLARPSGAERSAVRLGDCIVMNAATYSPSKDAWPFVNYLDTGSITDNRVDSYQYLNLEGGDTLPTRARRRVNEGDIVYSTVRPNKRHFGLLRELPENPLVSTGFAVFRGRERYADTGFIYRYLTQDQVVNDLHTIAEHSTSAYPSIRPSDIERVDISLPPSPNNAPSPTS